MFIPGKLVETVIIDEFSKPTEKLVLPKKINLASVNGSPVLPHRWFFEGINKHVNKYDLLDIIHLGFQTAFDKVFHHRLLSCSNSAR